MNAGMNKLAGKLTPIPPGKYLVGFSGGADSTGLLHLLLARRDAWGLELTAVHVNHGLRGAASDGDESWCAETCARLKIPIRISRIELNGRRDENSARDARMTCFRKWTEETGARGIILAHQQDDAAETFLMRLLRGSGPDGLGVLPPENTVDGLRILRPMLRIGREELRSALREAGIDWREDASNLDETYLRNAVRMKLMPEMERLSHGAAKHMAAAAEMLRRDREWLESEARSFLARFPDPGWIRAADVTALPESLQTRVLRAWWLRDGPKLAERQLSAEQTEALLRLLAQTQGKTNLPGGFHAVRTGQNLHLTGPERSCMEETLWEAPETKAGNHMSLRMTASEGNPGDGIRTQEVPAAFPEGCVIRSRRPGDWICPFGSGRKKKLQDYLVDRKIDEPWRDRIPLLCRGHEVLWAGGVGTGNIPVWSENETNLRMTWHGAMPWAEQGDSFSPRSASAGAVAK